MSISQRLAALMSALAIMLLSGRSAAAQEDPNVKIMKRLFSKMTEVLTAGTNGAKPGQVFLVLLNPGIQVDPGLDFSKAEDRFLISELTNVIPTTTWLMAGDSAKRVDDVYQTVMESGEWGYVDLTSAQEKKLAAANALLFVNGDAVAGGESAALKRYWELKEAYGAAVIAYDKARVDKENGVAPSIPSEVRLRKEAALQRWESLGQKPKVEAALQDAYSLTTSTSNWFSRLRTRFNDNEELANGVTFHNTYSFPTYPNWFSNEGWSTFTFVESEIEKQSESNRVSYGGGGGAGWGLWRVSASAEHSQADTFAKSEIKALNLQMELKRVTIMRPWLSQLLFESSMWRFKPGFDDEWISNGEGTDTSAPEGMMPLYPVGLLLARNVKIGGENSTDIQTTFSSHTSGSASVGWGPFSVAGHYSEDKNRAYSKAINIANGIEIGAPQVIGYFCLVLKKTPHPTTNPKVKWLSDDSDSN